MRASLDRQDLASYVANQVSVFTPDGVVTGAKIQSYVDAALERTENCFSRVRIKYFHEDKETYFDHLHTDQYAAFLYFLANTVYRQGGDLKLASKVYVLNKALHAIDVFYEVELPEVFAFQHPVGTVLGRAKYSDGLFVYQRCSVGSNLEGQSPVMGKGVVMFGGSSVIGNSTIGDNCWLSVGTLVMDSDVPANSVAFGQSPNNVIKAARRHVFEQYFSPGVI